MKQSLLFLFLTLSFLQFSTAQTVSISGILQDHNFAPVAGVNITAANAETVSDETGYFKLVVSTAAENIVLTFSKPGMNSFEKTIKGKGQGQVSLGVVYFTEKELETTPEKPESQSAMDVITGEDRIPIITLSEGEEESELGPQNISGILSASRDPFIAAAAFNLSTGGFDIRGFRSETTVLFNGMPFNNIENGSVYWSIWGGLNDVTRNRESAIDLSANSYTFGGIGGYTAFDTRASKQRTQKRVSYMFSNRAYNGRLMATYSTGMQPNGWAFSFSGSKRWAEEGYVPGTFYDAYSYFASVDKQLDDNHLLNLTVLGSPIKRGSQGGSIQYANDLAGTNFYNPNWGYQNGKKRNARVVNAHQPLFILRHDWTVNHNTTVTTSVGYQTGKYGRTTLDWFNAPDPRADYYRNFPFNAAADAYVVPDDVNIYTQYDESSFLQAAISGTAVGREAEQAFLNDPNLLQIQWDNLYWGNVNNGQSYKNVPGNWSQVILSNQRSDATRFNASSTLESILSDHVTLNAGFTFQQEKTHYFKTVDDLMGGDYYVNIDRFAIFDNLPEAATFFDLENDNVVVREGDIHGWNYDITGRKVSPWLQAQFSYNKVDFFLAANMTTTEFWRTGYMRNGRFPDNSLGESKKQNFANYGAKGGVTLKFDARNYLYSNFAVLNRAPDPRIAYASARNRDQIVPGLTDENVTAWEAGFQHRSPNVKARATFFYTKINDGMKLNRFFLPGEISNFGTYILTGLDERHSGVELAAQIKLTTTLSANLAGAIGEYIYTSRPNGIFIQDDDGVIRDRGTIYTKNFYVPSAPQTALSFGLDYRSPKFWSLTLTVNYFDRNYIDFSPERRTEEIVFGLDQNSAFYKSITEQQKVPDAYTVDLFAYKSWKINHGMFFSLTGGVTNLLNNTNLIQGGYEQLRFERTDVERTGINAFPPRYFYAYGANFFILGALRF